MDAIVLVGGFGTRLLPLTKAVPKPLIPLANMPFLERAICWLRDAGIDHVILSLHYNAEQFITLLRERALGVELSFAVEETPLGTGGAIGNCLSQLRSDRCFILNGDIFTDLSLPDMLAAHRRAGAGVSIALTEVEDPSRYGVIETNGGGRILSFTEKPPRALAKSRDINAGIYIFERGLLDCIPEGKCSVEREVFPRLLEEDVFLLGYREPFYWTDLGTPADYLQAHRDILHRRVHVPLEYHEALPGVWVGEQLEMADDAFLRPPVLIGRGVRLASGAVVGPQVVLGDGVEVGADAVVEDSILWEQTRVGARSVVSGCVLGRGAQVSGRARDCLCEDFGVIGR